MAATDAKALPEGEAPKKSKLKFFIILFILCTILGAGGGGAYWWFFMRASAVAGAEDGAAAASVAGEAGNAQAEGAGANGAGGGQGESDPSPRLERQSDLPRSTGQVLPLPPFVVNLSDPTGKRYLRLGMEVEVNQDVGEVLKKQTPKVRDAVIMLLAGKTFADVSSAEGKVLLKAEVAARLNQILGGSYVVRVYFTEFVVE